MVANRRVLIADDEQALLDTYQVFLEPESGPSGELLDKFQQLVELAGEEGEEKGLELTLVHQGEEAIAAVVEAKKSSDPFAVAVLDMRMPPGIDGLETAARLREIDPNIHIVIVTAYSDYSSDQIRGVLHHDMLFYHKPFSQAEIRQVVFNACTSWERSAELREIRNSLEQRVEERTRQVERLAKMQQFQAFQSGMEEMSISVMHEIGNALTGAITMSEEIRQRTSDGKDMVRLLREAFEQKRDGEELEQLQQGTLTWIERELLHDQEQDVDHVLEGLAKIQAVVYRQQREQGGADIEEVGEIGEMLQLEEILEDLQLILAPQLEQENIRFEVVGEAPYPLHSKLSTPRFMQMMTRLFDYLIEQLQGTVPDQRWLQLRV